MSSAAGLAFEKQQLSVFERGGLCCVQGSASRLPDATTCSIGLRLGSKLPAWRVSDWDRRQTCVCFALRAGVGLVLCVLCTLCLHAAGTSIKACMQLAALIDAGHLQLGVERAVLCDGNTYWVQSVGLT